VYNVRYRLKGAGRDTPVAVNDQPVLQSDDPSTLDGQIYNEDLGLVDFLGGVQVAYLLCVMLLKSSYST